MKEIKPSDLLYFCGKLRQQLKTYFSGESEKLLMELRALVSLLDLEPNPQGEDSKD